MFPGKQSWLKTWNRQRLWYFHNFCLQIIGMWYCWRLNTEQQPLNKVQGCLFKLLGVTSRVSTEAEERTLAVSVLYLIQGTPCFCLLFFFPLTHCCFYGWANTDLSVPVSSHTVFVYQGGGLLYPLLCGLLLAASKCPSYSFMKMYQNKSWGDGLGRWERDEAVGVVEGLNVEG